MWLLCAGALAWGLNDSAGLLLWRNIDFRYGRQADRQARAVRGGAARTPEQLPALVVSDFDARQRRLGRSVDRLSQTLPALHGLLRQCVAGAGQSRQVGDTPGGGSEQRMPHITLAPASESDLDPFVAFRIEAMARVRNGLGASP